METAMVGRESMVGTSTILGSGRSRQWTWVTIGGNAEFSLSPDYWTSCSSRMKVLSNYCWILSIAHDASVTTLRLQHETHDHGAAVLLVADDSRSRG